MTLEDKSEASLLVEAGKAITEIQTYLNPSESTQLEDIVDDARNALRDPYTSKTMGLYITTLKKNNLNENAEELTKAYQKLREMAKRTPISSG